MQRHYYAWILLCLPLSATQATANLVANWQSATYFYQHQAIHYYYFDLQSQGGLVPAGTYQITCQIASPATSPCRTQLLTIPNQQNAIQQCLSTPASVSRYCLLFSPCQNNVNCNTVYYQSASCSKLTVVNQFNAAWYSVGRFYYLVPAARNRSNAPPAILCNFLRST